MGGVQSANVDRPALANPPTICERNIAIIQQELLKADEFKDKFYVRLNTIAKIEPDIAGAPSRCRVGLFLTDIRTGNTKQENRIVNIIEENNNPIVKSITADTNDSSGSNYVKPYYSTEQIQKYYADLQSYNASWTAFRWKSEENYDPPKPQWGDPIFEKNVEIYNNLFRSVLRKGTTSPVDIIAIESASGSIPGSTLINNYYQKYLSPLPADPAPPSPRLLTVPQINPTTSSASTTTALGADLDATVSNMQSQAKNLESYNVFLGPGSDGYDPPQLGDSYETVLIKYNKSYDIATSRGITASTIDRAGSEIPNANRRLMNRINNSVQSYRVPEPVLPATGIPRAARYKSYNFNERQQYLIDYSPVTGPNRDLLVKNFCNSLGYEAYSDKLPGCAPGDCCAPMPTAPAYNKEAAKAERAAAAAAASARVEGFSGSAKSKCAGGGISLAGRTVTVTVPRPPITLDPSQAMFAYRTTRPTDTGCPATKTEQSDDNTEALKELINKSRPELIKELVQTLKGSKLFELRCPADLT